MQVVTGNAACAIAARNSIFKVVPFAFVKPIFLAAKKTAVGDITTLAERRTKMLQKFAAFGVNEKRVCAAVGKAGVEEIGLSELEDLIGIHNAIRDNESTVDEAFPAEPKPIVFGGPKTEPPADPEEMKQAAQGKAGKAAKPAPIRATALETLRNLMLASKIEEPALLAHLFGKNLVSQGEKLEQIPDDRLTEIINNWIELGAEIRKEA
jgi:hypothetical protein